MKYKDGVLSLTGIPAVIFLLALIIIPLIVWYKTGSPWWILISVAVLLKVIAGIHIK